MRMLLAVGLMSAPLAASASDNSLITQFCKTAVKAELHRAGTVAPEGMVDDLIRRHEVRGFSRGAAAMLAILDIKAASFVPANERTPYVSLNDYRIKS